jgi:hypothetical protein
LASTNLKKQLVNTLEQASWSLELTIKQALLLKPLWDCTKGYLNGIRESMFVVKGVFKQGPFLNLKVLLDTRADCLYVS